MKKNLFSFLFYAVLSGILFLGFTGCNTEQIQDLSGSTNLNTLSVIQGVIGKSSVRSSLFSVASTSVTSEQTGSVLVEMGLLTDSGILLQKKVFSSPDADRIEFSFEGQFERGIPLRLRSYQNPVMDVILGCADKDVIRVEIESFKKAALATRLMEQSFFYKTWVKSESSVILADLEKIISAKIEPREDLELLVDNYERVGVNENGSLEIFPTTYYPASYRSPSKPFSWEESLSKEEDLSQTEEKKEQGLPAPVFKTVINLISRVFYQDRTLFTFGWDQMQRIEAPRLFSFRIEFSFSLDSGTRNWFAENLDFRLYQASDRKVIFLRDLNFTWINNRLLEVEMNLSGFLAKVPVQVYFSKTPPPSDPLEFWQAVGSFEVVPESYQ